MSQRMGYDKNAMLDYLTQLKKNGLQFGFRIPGFTSKTERQRRFLFLKCMRVILEKAKVNTA